MNSIHFNNRNGLLCTANELHALTTTTATDDENLDYLFTSKMRGEQVEEQTDGKIAEKEESYPRMCILFRTILWNRLRIFIPILFAVAYLVYIGFAVYYDPKGAIFVCIVALLVVYLTLDKLSNNAVSHKITYGIKRLKKSFRPRRKISLWIRR